MYDTTIESVDRIQHPGSGAILAHCMGLGKTLQTIAFLHTIMTHPTIKKTIRRVLIVCPKNVILNWCQEFDKWLSGIDSKLTRISVSLQINNTIKLVVYFRLAKLTTFQTTRNEWMC